MDVHLDQATRTVLVIDDDPDVCEALQIALEDWGLAVICAADGEQGIARALNERPDLIIIDMMMPKISGFMVLERLKQQHRLNVPMIMLTGNDSPHQRTYAEFLGVDHYLNKPVGHAKLHETIRQFLPSRRPAVVV